MQVAAFDTHHAADALKPAVRIFAIVVFMANSTTNATVVVL